MKDYTKDVVVTDGFAMDYCRFGHGSQTMVIIPGVSVEPVVPLAGFVAKQYERFHEDFTCYLFDRRRNFPDDYSIGQMADDTAAAMRALGLRGVCLFVTSQGGMVGITRAAKYPELVAKLALGSSSSYADAFGRGVLQQWIAALEQGDLPAAVNLFFEKVYSVDFRQKNAKALTMAAKIAPPEALPRLKTLCRACLDFDGREYARQLSCPCFVLGTKADEVFGPTSQAALAALLGCPSKIYDAYSHALYDETPDALAHLHAFFRA